jgi:hypothetical protein
VTDRSAAYERFMASTDIGYDEWHDGIGYDLEALTQLEGAERDEVERWLVARANEDWRDVEALAALGSSAAKRAVRETLRTGTVEQRLAAARHMPDDEDSAADGPSKTDDVEAAIIAGLEAGDLSQGLTHALTLAEEHPTPPVLDALFRCALRGSSVARVHAAALLGYLHGNAKEAFDWDRRPFWLEFGVEDLAAVEAAFRKLCEECGVDPARYLEAV